MRIPLETDNPQTEVSGYADTNITEFITECWAEALNNPAPRAFAERVARIVRRRYADQYPGGSGN